MLVQHHTQEITSLQRNDQQCTPLFFHSRDHVWLLLDMPCFKGKHHTLHPLKYAPYTILQRIGENVYQLDFPAQLEIHDVLNVNNLKLFESPLLEETTIVQHPMENIIGVQLHLFTDKILESKNKTTHQQQYILYLMGQKRQMPTQTKWISTTTLQCNFHHFMEDA